MVEKFIENSAAVQAHLNITQAIINRMATNSTSCKAWCITLVSAILVIVADKGKPEFAFIALVPIILFWLLDAYYLSLEKRFRESYNLFIGKLHGSEVVANDLYCVAPSGSGFKTFCAAFFLSFSTWPFYLTLFGMVLLVKATVIPSLVSIPKK